MPRQDVSEVRSGQFIVQIKNRPARITEYRINAFFPENFHQDLRAG
jgi:translation elongation factor P/translation initiation factor 5A